MATIVKQLETLELLHREFGFRYAELAHALDTRESTLHRWRCGGAEPAPVHLNRLQAMLAFLEELEDLFADRHAAAAWLDESLSVLRNRTPREMIVDGHVDRVTAVLYALNAGVSA